MKLQDILKSETPTKRKATAFVPKQIKAELNVDRIHPQDIDKLPDHIISECDRLMAKHQFGNALTEKACRPLVHSVCIWLLRLGVTSRTGHPEVFSKVTYACIS